MGAVVTPKNQGRGHFVSMVSVAINECYLRTRVAALHACALHAVRKRARCTCRHDNRSLSLLRLAVKTGDQLK